MKYEGCIMNKYENKEMTKIQYEVEPSLELTELGTFLSSKQVRLGHLILGKDWEQIIKKKMRECYIQHLIIYN